MRLKRVLKWLLGLLFILAGINHFVRPGFYVAIMPPYLPWHLELVYLSGLFEVLLAGVFLSVSADAGEDASGPRGGFGGGYRLACCRLSMEAE